MYIKRDLMITPDLPKKTNLEKILTGEQSVKEAIRNVDNEEALKQRHRNYYRPDQELDPVLAFHLGRKYQ